MGVLSFCKCRKTFQVLTLQMLPAFHSLKLLVLGLTVDVYGTSLFLVKE